MQLPNAAAEVVLQAKITGYLLSATHPDGRHKAVFFRRFGFDEGAWEVLAEALRQHASMHEVARNKPRKVRSNTERGFSPRSSVPSAAKRPMKITTLA